MLRLRHQSSCGNSTGKGAIYLSTLKYWVWLSALTELRSKTRFALVSVFGDPEKVFFADERLLHEGVNLSDTEKSLIANKNLDRTNEILEKCREDGITILSLQDVAYPQRLKNIFDPPVVLYIKGRLPAMDEEAAIGIVGTRKASPYGIKMARKLGYEVTKCGGLVVTGLAEGIDSASAQGALLAGGACIGVLGCAIDDVFPIWNGELYNDVAALGAIVSEYPPGERLNKKNFPERNRIISGLSLGVTVVEAPYRSGALITSAYALDQGREVFAVPGNADAVNSVGSNELIRNGAILVTKGWEILADFEKMFSGKLSESGIKKSPFSDVEVKPKEDETKSQSSTKTAKNSPETGKGFAKLRVMTDRKKIDNQKKREYIDLQEQLSGLNEKQLKIVTAMGEKAMHVDDIIEKSGLNAAETLSELTVLQIKGYVTQESGKRFTLNIIKR